MLDPANPRAAYDAVVADLTPAPASAGKMFGMPCLKSAATGKAFAGFYQDAMVFKLRDPELSRALALPGATKFDPSGMRPMTGWVVVPAVSAAEWPVLAKAALRGLGA
jgi:hypothetical protein